MLTTGAAPATVATTDEHDGPGSSSGAPSRTAFVAVGVFIVLRLALPGKLVVGPFGQVGAPATLWGFACLLIWLDALVRRRTVRLGRQPVQWALGMVLLAWLVSYALLPIRMPEVFETTAANAALLEMLSMVGVGLLAADGVATASQFVRLGRLVCIVWAFCSGVAVLQFLGVDLAEWILQIPGLKVAGDVGSVVQRGSFSRAAGTTSHPIEFAAMTAMVLPLALQLRPYARARWRWGAIVLVIALGVPVSLSRSGFVGLAIGLVAVGLSWSPARRRRTALGTLGLGLVLFATVPGLTGTISSMFTDAASDSSITTRTDDYAVVQPMIEERPTFGRGIGTFVPPRYRILDNQYLVTLLEAGAVGLASLLGFVVISALTAHQAWGRSPPGEGRDLARGLFAAILVAGATMAFFDGFSFHGFAGVLFLFAGLGGAAWRTLVADADADAEPHPVRANGDGAAG